MADLGYNNSYTHLNTVVELEDSTQNGINNKYTFTRSIVDLYEDELYKGENSCVDTSCLCEFIEIPTNNLSNVIWATSANLIIDIWEPEIAPPDPLVVHSELCAFAEIPTKGYGKIIRNTHTKLTVSLQEELLNNNENSKIDVSCLEKYIEIRQSPINYEGYGDKNGTVYNIYVGDKKVLEVFKGTTPLIEFYVNKEL